MLRAKLTREIEAHLDLFSKPPPRVVRPLSQPSGNSFPGLWMGRTAPVYEAIEPIDNSWHDPNPKRREYAVDFH